jgi:hypothetical protein
MLNNETELKTDNGLEGTRYKIKDVGLNYECSEGREGV